MKFWGIALSLALSLPVFSNISRADEYIVTMHSYPSRSRVQDFHRNGVTRVIVDGDYTNPQAPILVGYPSRTPTRNLNLVAPIPTEIYIDVSSYPSRANRRHLSQLDSHVAVEVSIRNCLSSRSEKNRLIDTEREMLVNTYCNTDRSYRRALAYASDVMNANPDVHVVVHREF